MLQVTSHQQLQEERPESPFLGCDHQAEGLISLGAAPCCRQAIYNTHMMRILPLDTFKLLSCPLVYYSVASSQAKIYNKIKSNKKFFICGSSCLRAINMVCKNLKVSFNAGKLNCFSAVCSSDYKEIPCALPASPAPFFCPQTAPETSDVLTSVPVRKDMEVCFLETPFCLM